MRELKQTTADNIYWNEALCKFGIEKMNFNKQKLSTLENDLIITNTMFKTAVYSKFFADKPTSSKTRAFKEACRQLLFKN